MPTMRWRVALFAAVLFSCGSPPTLRELGTVCTASEQCEARLTCIDTNAHFVASDDAGCIAGGFGGLKVCSLLCVSTEDCLAAGTASTCSFAGCAKVGYCLPINSP